jgi:hypothetical protein
MVVAAFLFKNSGNGKTAKNENRKKAPTAKTAKKKRQNGKLKKIYT